MIDYEDRISIPTPEGVDVDLVLAGLGSRLVAALLDTSIIGGIVLALWLIGAAAGAGAEGDGGFVAAGLVVVSFVVLFGYDVVFETLASGRTPGKRAAGLRVVRLGGEPPGFLTAAVRNLLRLIDILPGFYAVGAVSILASRHNQRLGDHAAGTLVVRERLASSAARVPPPADWTAADRLAAWDVSAITPYELVTVRRFLERRHDLQPVPRARLAAELAERLRPKVIGAPPAAAPEEFLEDLATAKASRG
jgi:uncharacterized RDD family membrane protein YckC